MKTHLPSPLKRHGGKHYLARRIVALMPPHVQYVEPFAGSLAVLLAHSGEGVSEVVNDIDGPLMSFWRVLQDEQAFARFARIVEAVPVSEQEWLDAGDQLQDSTVDPVRRAVAFFIRCRQSRQALMTDFATVNARRTRRGMNEYTSAWQSAVKGLPDVAARLRRVVVLNRPALDVVRQHDGPGTLFYCDPPYLHDTRTARDAYGEHEMSEADHRELLDLIRECRGKVMLSGYPSELYDSALASWTRHTFDMPNQASGAKRKQRKTEVVWCNF